MNRIKPDLHLRAELLKVEKPARYVGGEYGIIEPDLDAPLRVLLCFPDLYEIGMSNLAIRLLYQRFNAITGVSCERVFAPAADFEEILRSKNIPLYSLESGTPLAEFDILGFSIGYELSATNMLQVMDLGGIPLRCSDRGESDPIVIAGGPAVTNPAPFGAFLDGVLIGEAEAAAPGLLEILVELHRRDSSRADRLEKIQSHESIWFKGKQAKVKRALWMGFSELPSPPLLPVPALRTVQDHGVIEIMRGCPNGCRFCHAGIFYRPFREKPWELIKREAQNLVELCGYREITVASLSSGDYSDISQVVRNLNAAFGYQKVSFAFPSLRVDSFTLPLLAEISHVRKSGITFAVETAVEQWQMGLNKEVRFDKVVSVLREARELGWRVAKFYFMLGLPVSGGEDEIGPITEFLSAVRQQTELQINLNIAAFVPKPHTPFQWAPQIGEQDAMEGIGRLKSELGRKGVAVRYNSPFSSLLEGVISRGDERVGDLIERAFRQGARLDAWEEHLDRRLWTEVFSRADWPVEREICQEKDPEDPLPWDSIALGVGKSLLQKEYSRAMEGVQSAPCAIDCEHNCGVCNQDTRPKQASSIPRDPAPSVKAPSHASADGAGTGGNNGAKTILFSFSKNGVARFLSHLNVMSMFERTMLRSGTPVRYTNGYNPKPKLEFAHPLSLGIASIDEVAKVELTENHDVETWIESMNRVIHGGILVVQASLLAKNRRERLPSLMSLYWGAEYQLEFYKAGSDAAKQRELLQGKIESYSRDRNISECIRIKREGEDRLFLTVHQTNREANLIRMLSSIYETEEGSSGRGYWDSIDIKRLRTYARSSEDKPVPFFEAFDRYVL